MIKDHQFSKCPPPQIDGSLENTNLYNNLDFSTLNKHAQWQEILHSITEPITTDDNENKVIIEGMNIPKRYLADNIVSHIIDTQTYRIKTMPGLSSQHKIAKASIKKNCQNVNLYFKENPVAPGREYLAQQLYFDLIGHGCANSELVQFTVNNISYPVLIIEYISGPSLFEILQNKQELPVIDPVHKSLMYLASLFELQEDGKGQHFLYTAAECGQNAKPFLCKIDLDHAFLPSEVITNGKLKLQQKNILYCVNEWLDDFLHPYVIAKWLALDKKTFFTNLITKLIHRDQFYYNLFGLHQEERVNQFYSQQQYLLIESMLPINLMNEWLQISERITWQFEEITQQKRLITHKDFIKKIIPLAFKLYQPVLKRYPHAPLKAFAYIAQDGYIFSQNHKMFTQINGRDLLLSSLKYIPSRKDIQNRTINSTTLLYHLNEMQDKNKMITSAAIELTHMTTNIFFKLPSDWCEEVMDILMDKHFSLLTATTQKFIINNLCKLPLKRLRIENTKILNNQLLKSTLKQLPSLLHLQISNCPKLKRNKFDNFFNIIAKYSPNLERLDVQDLSINPTLHFKKHLYKIPFFNIFKKFIFSLSRIFQTQES